MGILYQDYTTRIRNIKAVEINCNGFSTIDLKGRCQLSICKQRDRVTVLSLSHRIGESFVVSSPAAAGHFGGGVGLRHLYNGNRAVRILYLLTAFRDKFGDITGESAALHHNGTFPGAFLSIKRILEHTAINFNRAVYRIIIVTSDPNSIGLSAESTSIDSDYCLFGV